MTLPGKSTTIVVEPLAPPATVPPPAPPRPTAPEPAKT
jgi:hypothetical protein